MNMSKFVLRIIGIRHLSATFSLFIYFSILASVVLAFEPEKNLYSDKKLVEPNGNPAGLFKKPSSLIPPTREKSGNFSNGSVRTDSNVTVTENKDETLLAEISHLSAQLSQKELELTDECAQKAKILAEFEEMKLDHEDNKQKLDILKAIKMRDFGSENDIADIKNRNTHINGWYYVNNRGWFWTNSQVFPMIFSAISSHWFYSEFSDNDLQLFFNYQTQEWEKW